MNIRMISIKKQKAAICNMILRNLTDWFEIEEAIINYTHESQYMVFWTEFDEEKPIGFLALKNHNAYTSEIYVMGVLKEYQRRNIGSKLIEHCENYCRKAKIEFLTVKTLDESIKNENYHKTRTFYHSVGFRPLEIFPLYWSENNPCLFMAKAIISNDN